jgi:hypothetical protein
LLEVLRDGTISRFERKRNSIIYIDAMCDKLVKFHYNSGLVKKFDTKIQKNKKVFGIHLRFSYFQFAA